MLRKLTVLLLTVLGGLAGMLVPILMMAAAALVYAVFDLIGWMPAWLDFHDFFFGGLLVLSIVYGNRKRRPKP